MPLAVFWQFNKILVGITKVIKGDILGTLRDVDKILQFGPKCWTDSQADGHPWSHAAGVQSL